MLKNLNQPPLRTAEHVAIIMDGNGRWAKARGMPRTFGHKAGVEAVRRTVKAAPAFGIRHLTLYAFSSENWARPPEEVRDLLGLLKLYIRRDLAELTANGVRIRIIGSRDNLPKDILSLIEGAEAKTAANTDLNLNIAFNYGGRDEIVRAVQSIVEEKAHNACPVTADDVSRALDTAHCPDPDLVIRTSGEVRLSNFLLWQIAYAEFVFLDCMWPDFDETQLRQALTEFTSRDRRYGGVEAMKDAAL